MFKRIKKNRESHRNDIDGLRGIAVLSVVLFHIFPSLCRGGYVGVDIFFVISGYLITSIILNKLESGNFSFTNFYARRIRRIFPSLAIVLGSSLVIGWFVLFPDEFKQLGKHVAGGAFFVSNFILRKEVNYFDNAVDTKPLLHLWSLGIEEQFYIIWPLLVFILWRKRSHGIMIGIAIATLSFVLNVAKLESAPAMTFYSPFTRFWELLAGSMLAYFQILKFKYYEKFANKFNTSKSIIGLILLMTGILHLDSQTPFPGWAALLPTIGSFLLISSDTSTWVNQKVLSNGILVWFGTISYSLYLWHWPLLSFARIVESDTPLCWIRILIILLSILLAWLSTFYCENQFRFGKDSTYKVAIPSISIIFLGMLGLWINSNNGFEGRLTELEKINNQLTRPPETNQGCFDFFKDQTPLFPYCKFVGEIHSQREIVVLIGDSHAFVLFEGLSQVLKEKGKDTLLMANTGCPPLKGIVQGNTKKDFPECEKRVNNVLNLAINHPALLARNKVVIITTRGSAYITKRGYEPIEPKIWHVKFTDSNLDKLAPEDAFAQSLITTSKLLIKANKNVIYIMENPELGFDVRKCISRPMTLSKKDHQQSCILSLNTVLNRQRLYRQALLKINLEGLTLLDPLPLHCPSGICNPIIDNQLLYVDDNHWSVDGSLLIAKKLLIDYL